MDILEREGLIERGGELEGELLATLAPLADHPLVGEVRGGTGALVGIAFDQDALAADPTLPVPRHTGAIRPHGVILRALGDSLAVSPPLTITSEEIELIHDAVAGRSRRTDKGLRSRALRAAQVLFLTD